MATTSICAKLNKGQDISCVSSIVKKYYQEAVVINHSDVNFNLTGAIQKDCTAGSEKYGVKLTLKSGAKGYRFKSIEGGTAVVGSYDKGKTEVGFPQYLHKVQIPVTGVNAEAKCILDALDKGSFLIALQAKDGTVEIYGFENGMGTADYTRNITENGGVTLLTLQSNDDNQESHSPLLHIATDVNADFDSLFEVPTAV